MVAVAAAEDTDRNRSDAGRRRQRRWLAFGGSILAATAIGFLAVALQADPNEQLIDDLPVLENLDEYRKVDDIEFLRRLHDSGLFPEEGGDE